MKLIDLSGRRFGRLAVIERAESGSYRRPHWHCRCECGTDVVASGAHLRQGVVAKCFTACVLATGRTPWPADPRYLVHEDGSIVGPRGAVLRTFFVDGYPRINVVRSGRHTSMPVHIVVCETFHGPRPDGMEVAHEDGDPGNPRATNLSWKTPKGNNADKVRHGTDNPGERNPQHKLTEVDVREIRQSSRPETELAMCYGVSRSAIGLVRRQQTWRHIDSVTSA